jgi:hypothetical protein
MQLQIFRDLTATRAARAAAERRAANERRVATATDFESTASALGLSEDSVRAIAASEFPVRTIRVLHLSSIVRTIRAAALAGGTT